MFSPAKSPRIFALPPGADFATALVAGLRDRLAGQPPEAMARITLFLNTAKMRERVIAAFQTCGPGFMPPMRLVGELGTDPAPGLAPAVSPLRRRLELAVLVGRLVALQGTHAPGNAVYDLADSLADLMEEMHDQGISPDALLNPGLSEDHAEHWQRSLAFLQIITPWFTANAEPDRAARQRRMIERQITAWQAEPPADPVIVAGSTGSRGSTALLMEAVAHLPQGALILPGFDDDMPDFGWNSLSSGPVPDEDHPQYRYARLLNALGVQPVEVVPWQAETAPDAVRNRLISLALRPAPVTDQWLSEGKALLPLTEATLGLTLIEAENPRQEALAIAVALRAAAERGQRAALISPDRTLARRVAAALDQWGIRPDDSAGRPLPLTAPGRFLRHIAELMVREVTAEQLVILLKHPLTASAPGLRGDHLRHSRDLELKLRRYGPAFPSADTIRAFAKAGNDPTLAPWGDWLAGWLDSLSDLQENTISARTETVLTLAEALAAGPGGEANDSELWRTEAGEKTRHVIDRLLAEAAFGPEMTAASFADLLGSLLEKEAVRANQAAHPLITIQGPREARELQADLVIMGGLNDGIWPAPPAPDPWLSRQMRLNIGLLLPERQIGLSAHDFQQAAGAARVIMTRALRDDEAQTVPSRWLDRLVNLTQGLEGEEGSIAQIRARGQHWLSLAKRMETVAPVPAAPRPSPRPPEDARPRELPVTAISRLIRDPYAVYAQYILRLRPLDPIHAEADPRERGMVMHKIVEDFVKSRPAGEGAEQGKTRLLDTAEQVLAQEIPWPSAQRMWLGRLAAIADKFVAGETLRATIGQPVLMEKGGAITLEHLNFRLTARPDRIDQAADGSLHIYDYKSGSPPSKDQLKSFEKQLPLEAAMAERGAFESIGPQHVRAVSFISLGSEGKVTNYTTADLDFDEHWQKLHGLIARYAMRDQGYTARRALFKEKDTGDYDHLARFGEWLLSDDPTPEDVG